MSTHPTSQSHLWSPANKTYGSRCSERLLVSLAPVSWKWFVNIGYTRPSNLFPHTLHSHVPHTMDYATVWNSDAFHILCIKMPTYEARSCHAEEDVKCTPTGNGSAIQHWQGSWFSLLVLRCLGNYLCSFCIFTSKIPASHGMKVSHMDYSYKTTLHSSTAGASYIFFLGGGVANPSYVITPASTNHIIFSQDSSRNGHPH